MRGTEHLDSAVVKPHADLTHPPNVSHPVTDQDRRMTFVNNLLHSIEAFLLEDSVSDRQYFVEDDDFRVQMGCDRKRQPNVHATGIIDQQISRLSYHPKNSKRSGHGVDAASRGSGQNAGSVGSAVYFTSTSDFGGDL
jgi:hypothetical protein